MTAPRRTRERLATVRAQREALLREREALEHRPCSREEAHARVLAYLDAVALHIPVRLEVAADWFAAPTAPQAAPDLFAPQTGDRWIGAFILDVARPFIEARLDAALDARDWGNGITTADREAELHRFGQELSRLECEEERLIRALEQEGEDVDRRPDVDPAVIVACDADFA